MFQCLEAGYQNGEVDYESRQRSRWIETDKSFAADLVKQILQQISKENKNLLLLTYYDERQITPEISSNYFREIAYNLEHTIHHMALIKVGLREIGNMQLGVDPYGVASSTIKYRKQCAQ